MPLHRLPTHHEQRLLSLGVALPEAAFRLTSGEPRALQRVPDSGRLNTRFICPDCACWVYSQPRGGVVRVRAGSLDDTSWLRPTRHIWTRSKQPWVAFAEGKEVLRGSLPSEPTFAGFGRFRGPDRAVDRLGQRHIVFVASRR